MLSGVLHWPPSLYHLNKHLLSRPAALLLEETRAGTSPTPTATGPRPSVCTKATPRSPTGPALKQQPKSSLQRLALPIPKPVAKVTSLWNALLHLLVMNFQLTLPSSSPTPHLASPLRSPLYQSYHSALWTFVLLLILLYPWGERLLISFPNFQRVMGDELEGRRNEQFFLKWHCEQTSIYLLV